MEPSGTTAQPLPLLSQGAARLLLLAAFVAVLPYLLIAFYARPCQDDFIYANRVRKLGVLRDVAAQYLHRTGRYSAHFCMDAFYALGDTTCSVERLYFMGTWAAMALLAVSLVAFCRSLAALGDNRSWSSATGTALVLFAVYVSHVYAPVEAFYWYPTVCTYTIASACFLLALAIVLWPPVVPRIWPRGLACALITLVGVGFNETNLLFIGAVIAAGVAAAYLRWLPNRRMWLILAVAFAVAFALVVLTPGVKQTAHEFDCTRSVWRSAIWACYFTCKRLRVWLLSPAFIGATLLAVVAGVRWQQKVGLLRRVRLGYVPLGPAFLFAALALLCFPYIYVSGWEPKSRVYNTLDLFLCVGWPLCCVLLGAGLRNAGQPIKIHPLLVSWLAVAIVIGMLFANQSGLLRCAWDLATRAPAYAREAHARERLIRDAIARGVTDLTVPAFTSPPRTIHYLDITDDPAWSSNRAAAAYWGLHNIRVDHCDEWVELKHLW